MKQLPCQSRSARMYRYNKGWILFSDLNLLISLLAMPKAWSSYAKPKNFEFVALEDFSEGNIPSCVHLV